MASDNMKEEISALMDGEVERQQMQQLIRQLRDDPDGRGCWERYHLISDALRNNLPPHVNRSFVSNISQAIANENLLVSASPAPNTPAKAKRPAAVAGPWAGFALAASVAAVAYLGVGVTSQEDRIAGPSLASQGVGAPIAPLAHSAAPADLQVVEDRQWNVLRPDVETRLNNYLYSHRNVAGNMAINPAVLPNARVVAQPPRGE